MNELATRLLLMAGANAAVATLLGLCAWLLMRRREHRLAHLFCVLALVKLVTPPLIELPVVPAPQPETVAAPTEVVATAAAIGPALPPPPAPFQLSWPGIVVGLLGVGSALLFLRAARFAASFRRLMRATSSAPRALIERARQLASRMGLERCPDLRVVDATISPMLCVHEGRARIVLPRALLTSATPAQIDALLAHELAHASRRDHWVRPLELFATGTYWWLPTTWLLRRTLRAAEERACDERVLAALPGAGRVYADALLATLDFLANSRWTVPSTACGAGSFQDIQSRLTTIMSDSNLRPLPRIVRAFLLTAAVAALPLVPTRAQQSPRPDDAARQERIEARIEALKREQAELQAKLKEMRRRSESADPTGDGADVAPLKVRVGDLFQKHAARADGPDVASLLERAHSELKLRQSGADADPRANDDHVKLLKQHLEALHALHVKLPEGVDPGELKRKIHVESMLRKSAGEMDQNTLEPRMNEAHLELLKQHLEKMHVDGMNHLKMVAPTQLDDLLKHMKVDLKQRSEAGDGDGDGGDGATLEARIKRLIEQKRAEQETEAKSKVRRRIV